MKKKLLRLLSLVVLLGGAEDTNAQNIAVIKNNGDITTYDMNQVDRVAMFMNDEYTDLTQKVGDFIVNDLNSTNPKSIELDRPTKCCKVNIIASALPVTKTDNIPGYVEFWDADGNYFKMQCVLNAQGASSMSFAMKNISIDLEKEVKFGDWVSQDGFHLKAYYQDNFRGITNICYNWAEDLIKYTGIRANRNIENADPEALCHPDGFPVELYFNDEYYSLYVWNLKKHRKNFSMNKKDYKSLILDGKLDGNTFWNGKIDWTAFELKNPKTLICMDGSEYDGDNPMELIDSSSEFYNPSNKDHVNTAITKELLVKLSKVIPKVAKSEKKEAKQLYEEVFDKDAMMLYYIMSQVILHHDGFAKNWVWTMYDGGVAAPNIYDTDATFGRINEGSMVMVNFDKTLLSTGRTRPSDMLYHLYFDEIKKMYQDLRRAKKIDVDHIMSFFDSWTDEVGEEAYARDREAHPDIPSYRYDGLNKSYWMHMNVRDGGAPKWDKSTTYSVGSMVRFDRYQFICIKEHTNQQPLTVKYKDKPTYGGMFDSKERIREWLIRRIMFLDEQFGYKK